MKNIASIFLVSFFIFLASATAAAQSPLYDFGTIQQVKTVQAEPGDTVNLSVLFFVTETYGNRITHVRLTVADAPPGWDVEFNPPVHDEYLNVSGIITVSHENIFVPPLPVLSEPPQVSTPGIEYIRAPNGQGYLQAKRVQAVVKVPKDAEIGKSYVVKLLGAGFWFGQSGTVALEQTRSFQFQIKMVKKEYSEQIIAPPVKPNTTNATAAPAGAAAQSEFPYLYIVGVIVLLAILLAAYRFFKKK